MDQHTSLPAHIDRVPAFQRYAELRARGEVEVPPHLLGPRERRLHVRNTLLEDHSVRLAERPEAVAGKFALLAADPFTFFRGTALLYYRDHAGVDGHLPLVFSIGDAHPENFGIMPSARGVPFFGANDFDEAWIAPFTYDVCRGAVGFWMAARGRGLSGKKIRKVVAAFVEGYLRALEVFAADDSEATHQFTADRCPDLLDPWFEKAGRSRATFLRKRVDGATDRFVADDRIEPHQELIDVLQPVVDSYAAELDDGGRPDGFFRIHDVAYRHGGGTASQGLDRYWVLLDGWGPDPDEDVIIELKAARRSALSGLVPETSYEAKSSAERITFAQREFLVDGDALYGAAEIDGRSYVVRERSPMKVNINLEDLSADDLAGYARVCGGALAQPHARSETLAEGAAQGEIERRILAVVRDEVFSADILEFAEDGAERVGRDHQLFLEDLGRGAFDVAP